MDPGQEPGVVGLGGKSTHLIEEVAKAVLDQWPGGGPLQRSQHAGHALSDPGGRVGVVGADRRVEPVTRFNTGDAQGGDGPGLHDIKQVAVVGPFDILGCVEERFDAEGCRNDVVDDRVDAGPLAGDAGDDPRVGSDLTRDELFGQAIHGFDAHLGRSAGGIDREDHASALRVDHAHHHDRHSQVVLGHAGVGAVGTRRRVPQRRPHEPHRLQERLVVVDFEERPVLAREGRDRGVFRRRGGAHRDLAVAAHLRGQAADVVGQRGRHRRVEERGVDPGSLGDQVGPGGCAGSAEVIQERAEPGVFDEVPVASGGDRPGRRDAGAAGDQPVEGVALATDRRRVYRRAGQHDGGGSRLVHCGDSASWGACP